MTKSTTSNDVVGSRAELGRATANAGRHLRLSARLHMRFNMKQNRIELQGMATSQDCRTYSYSVQGVEGEIRNFIVEISLRLFTNELKFQDGPLLTRERLISELAAELTGAPVPLRLQINELDILRYADKHYPKSSIWKRFHQQ